MSKRKIVCPKTVVVGGRRRKVTATKTSCSVTLASGKRKRVPAASQTTHHADGTRRRAKIPQSIRHSARVRGVTVSEYLRSRGR